MRKSIIVLFGILVILALFSIAGVIYFKEKKKTVYILTEKIFADFEGTKEIKKKFSEIEKKQKSMLDSVYLEIQNSGKAGKVGEATLKREQEVYQRLYSGFTASNQKQMKEYDAAIWKQINQYLEEYGKEKGYDYILGATGDGNVMFANASLNVTEDVIRYLNKKYADD